MRWRRRPSAAHLERWLATGEPVWVERWLDDPGVTGELERLSALDPATVQALEATLAPADRFEERTADALQAHVDDLERVGVLFSLLGLAPHVAGSWLDPEID